MEDQLADLQAEIDSSLDKKEKMKQKQFKEEEELRRKIKLQKEKDERELKSLEAKRSKLSSEISDIQQEQTLIANK